MVWSCTFINLNMGIKAILIRMNTDNLKTKLTVTIDRKILNEAKKLAARKRIPLSRLIENYLQFFINPRVYCFKCGKKFSAKEAELCPKCGWMICSHCKSCRCGLSEETAVAIFCMKSYYNG